MYFNTISLELLMMYLVELLLIMLFLQLDTVLRTMSNIILLETLGELTGVRLAFSELSEVLITY
jgi:hypothetical protein